MKRSSVLLVLSLGAGSMMIAAEKSRSPGDVKDAPVVLSKMVVSGTRIPSGWFTIAWEVKGSLPMGPIKRAWVSNLLPGSPADSAGVQIGDRVVAIDDVPVEKMNGLLLRSSLEREHAAGSQITFLLSSTEGARRHFVVTFESGTKRAR
jgi:S1-C subfamily serine protease